MKVESWDEYTYESAVNFASCIFSPSFDDEMFSSNLSMYLEAAFAARCFFLVSASTSARKCLEIEHQQHLLQVRQPLGTVEHSQHTG